MLLPGTYTRRLCHAHRWGLDFYSLSLTIWTIQFPSVRELSTGKENCNCHGAPSTFTLEFIVRAAIRLKAGVHRYKRCQPQAVPAGIWAKQSVHNTSLRWQGRSAEIREVSPLPPHIRLCAEQLSGQTRRLLQASATDRLSQGARGDACNRVHKERALWYCLFRNCEQLQP